MAQQKISELSIFMDRDPLDVYLPTLEESRYLKRKDAFMKRMMKQTHFNEKEMECSVLIFYKLVNQTQKKHKSLSNEQFVTILSNTFKMTDEKMNYWVILALAKKSGGKKITLEIWMKAISLFLRGNLEEKIKFAFSVYDIRRSGFIGGDTMFFFLKNSFFTADGKRDEDSTKDLIDIVMKKMDADRDGKISFSDYRKCILRHPCMLEFLGQCYPDREAIFNFMSTLTTDIKVE